MACDQAFWLKTLSKSSEVIELDLKLGESPDGNFWHKYRKAIWGNGKQIKNWPFLFFLKIKIDFFFGLVTKKLSIFGISSLWANSAIFGPI